MIPRANAVLLLSTKLRVERMLTERGEGFRSNAVNLVCYKIQIRHLSTRPYTPKTNGNAKRLVQPLLGEWAYRRAYRISKERRIAFKRYVPR